MARPLRISTREFWAPAAANPAVEHWAFDGVDELNRLSHPQLRFTPLDDSFTARLTRLPLDGCAIEFWGASPHRAERVGVPVSAPVLIVVMVVSGRLDVHLPDRSFPVEAGEAFLADTRRPVTATAPAGVEMLRAVIDLEAVRDGFDPEREPLVGPLPQDPLLESFTAFVAATLRGAVGRLQVDHDRIGRALIELESALIGEAQRVADAQDGPASLRNRIRRHIHEHADDPALDAAAVARAVGVSVGHAHAVFNEGERTIAHEIRARRVAAAIGLLRGEHRAVRMLDIAERAGFSGVEAMRRAFLAELGTTPAEVRDRPDA